MKAFNRIFKYGIEIKNPGLKYHRRLSEPNILKERHSVRGFHSWRDLTEIKIELLTCWLSNDFIRFLILPHLRILPAIE